MHRRHWSTPDGASYACCIMSLEYQMLFAIVTSLSLTHASVCMTLEYNLPLILARALSFNCIRTEKLFSSALINLIRKKFVAFKRKG